MAAIGASAGGLEALEELFAAVPKDSGIAYVVVTHQHPDQATLLAELIARHASIPVVTAADGARLEIDHAYVNPPGGDPSIEDGVLRVRPAAERQHLPIDRFFRSVAESCGEDAIAVVLSGTGSDGAVGIASVKERGGMVAAQDPASAQYAGMPRSAIETRLVDIVQTPAGIAEQLVRYVRRAHHEPVQNEGGVDAVNRVLLTLRNRTGHDFTAYKRSTMHRRIERRMGVRGIDTLAAYARTLLEEPVEVDALFKDLLISVTSFFRDPDAFAALQVELKRLVAELPSRPIRAWVPGCATGEEVYSLAIVLQEVLDELGKPNAVQIFATDLDEHALDVARAGRYPAGIGVDVGAERLARFFTYEDNSYRIAKPVRESIVFAAHNVIRDPPFARLDVVSCRNLLIYLEAEPQRRLLGLFAYALGTGGLLFLSSSESVTGLSEVFEPVDKKAKLFRRRSKRVPVPVAISPQGLLAAHDHAGRARAAPTIGVVTERALLSTFVPPSVLVNEHGQILFIHGRTGDYLEPAAGEPTDNVFSMAREGLRIELLAAVRQVADRGQPVVRHGLQVKTNGGFSAVTLRVQRLETPEPVRGMLLVSFELEPAAASQESSERKAPSREADLERALEDTRANLQGTVEELATSNEELKSSNEELQSINEELQSTNEELETSREEMQSLNEELRTVNSELAERNRELAQANDDMQNLLNSTDIAIVFLDDALAIQRFTSQARAFFHIIDSDIGRPISDLAPSLRYERLVADARDVLRTLVPVSREIQSTDGKWISMQVRPYRTTANVIEGLVIAFVDIDDVKRRELESAQAFQSLRNVVDVIPRAWLLLDAELNVLDANAALHEMLQLGDRPLEGERLADLAGGLLDTPALLEALRALAAGSQAELELDFVPSTGRLRGSELHLSARRVVVSPGAGVVLVVEARKEGSGADVEHTPVA